MPRGLPQIVAASPRSFTGRILAQAFFTVICVVSLLPGVSRVRSADVPTAGSENASPATPRLREGAGLVDVLGHFGTTGERITFYPLESHAGYTGLENLGLERVALMLNENLDQMVWSVSGTISEFHGANYILVSKAVLKSRAHTSDVASPRAKTPSRPMQKKTGAKSSRQN